MGAMRTICFAYREFSKDKWEQMTAENNEWVTEEDYENLGAKNMTLIGIFALMDPLRPGIIEAV